LERLPDGLPDALDPGFHCVGTHWIRGFIAFQLARGTGIVVLMVPAGPESGFGNVPPGAMTGLGKQRGPCGRWRWPNAPAGADRQGRSRSSGRVSPEMRPGPLR
jgi:hypothetical protein